jgi:hypothetical protein
MTELWDDFRQKVIPEAASDVQVTEMRLAFFMGAHDLLALLLHVLSPDAEPTADDIRNMVRLDQEIHAELAAHAARARQRIAEGG